MTEKSKKVLDAALSLSEEDRAEVIEHLLSSLDDSVDEAEIDEAWRIEISKRSKEIEMGTVKPSTWNRVKELARKHTG